jgi:ribosomal protein S18 acetylase RimI-like enzyme
MQTTVRVRRARANDAPAIARVHVETWRAAYAGLVPDEYLVRMTENGQAFTWRKTLSRKQSDSTVLVAEAPPPGQSAPHSVVGFGSCGPNRGSKLAYGGEVYTLYVAQDWQGQGIGRKLLGGLFRTLYDQGYRDCIIWVLAANPARFFYERMGGQRIAERGQEFAGEVLEEAAYGWPDLEDWLRQTGG